MLFRVEAQGHVVGCAPRLWSRGRPDGAVAGRVPREAPGATARVQGRRAAVPDACGPPSGPCAARATPCIAAERRASPCIPVHPRASPPSTGHPPRLFWHMCPTCGHCTTAGAAVKEHTRCGRGRGARRRRGRRPSQSWGAPHVVGWGPHFRAGHPLGPPRSPRPVAAGDRGAGGEPLAAAVSRRDGGGPSRDD